MVGIDLLKTLPWFFIIEMGENARRKPYTKAISGYFTVIIGGFFPPLHHCGIVIGLQIALHMLGIYKIYKNSVNKFSLICSW